MHGLRPDEDVLSELKDLSARLGRNPQLVQAASGNTSIKLGRTLWIKASGHWLARADQDEMFVPVDLTSIDGCLEDEELYAATCCRPAGASLWPSIETAMHAVLPHRVVIHVHSVNAICWAVRQDGEAQLNKRLAGLPWKWVPYVSSGIPLAQAIQRASRPAPEVLVLANHGLVIGGENCEAAEKLLGDVENRLSVAPRTAAEPNRRRLEALSRGTGWRVPAAPEAHALGTDPISREIISGGTLYPCHGMFLGPGAGECSSSTSEACAIYQKRYQVCPTTLLVRGAGVLVTKDMTLTQLQVLAGLSQVTQRISAGARIRYMAEAELGHLLNHGGYQYRQTVENNSTRCAQASV